MTSIASRTLAAASATALLLLLTPALAAAQPGPPPPPPPGYGGGGYYGEPPPRQGLAIGVGLGVGGMGSDSGITDCIDCGDTNPASLGLDFHIGGMLNPQTALLFEVWGTGQTLDADGFNILTQTMVMGALQYWLSPEFWIKGGLGVAALDVQYDDGYVSADDEVDRGMALMGAAGYELARSTTFAVDLQLRLGSGSYHGIDDRVNTAMVGIGFNWY